MAEKQMPVYCPNCETVIYRLSLDLVKQVKELTIQCELCGHKEQYNYNERDDSVQVIVAG
jgi:RNase P subunit RPR2